MDPKFSEYRRRAARIDIAVWGALFVCISVMSWFVLTAGDSISAAAFVEGGLLVWSFSGLLKAMTRDDLRKKYG